MGLTKNESEQQNLFIQGERKQLLRKHIRLIEETKELKKKK